jgi:hypothetical protein
MFSKFMWECKGRKKVKDKGGGRIRKTHATPGVEGTGKFLPSLLDHRWTCQIQVSQVDEILELI